MNRQTLQIKLYNRPVENAIFIPDFMMKDEILKCIKSPTTLITHQQIVLYVVRALIADKTINNNDVECYVDSNHTHQIYLKNVLTQSLVFFKTSQNSNINADIHYCL